MMEKLFVLDASGYIYRSYFAIRNMTNDKGESTNALFGFIRSILKLFKDFQPEHFVAVFDGPNNAKARLEIYPEYKAHRAEMPPDLRAQIGWAEEFCTLMGLPSLKVPEVEADDTMGAVAKWAESKGAKVFLCTSDKDMAQLVNDNIFILNTHKENLILDSKQVEETYGVPPHLIVDLLAMIGDASDNVPGVPGIGPKTAVALLQEFGSLDAILSEPQKLSGKKKDVFIQHKEDAALSRKLVTLNLDVNFPKDSTFFHIQKPSYNDLKAFYSSMSFHSLIRELEQSGIPDASQKPIEELTRNYKLIDDQESLNSLIHLLLTKTEICLDTETTHYLPIESELVGVGLGFEAGSAWYIPVNGNLGQENVLKALKPLLENPKIGFYGHNIKFDFQVLQNYGIKIAKISFDTILASYVLNAHQRQHSLDFLIQEYFPGSKKITIAELIGKGKNTITMREVPIERVCEYCCEDVDFTIRIKSLLEPKLEERKLNKVYHEIELPLIKVLAKMERHGIYIDLPVLSHMGIEVSEQLRKLEKTIYEMAGEEFNLNSPKQLSEILFTKLQIKPPKKTATGLSTNADVLEFLQNDYPIAGKIIDYRTLEKLRSTYIDSLPTMVNAKTHRIHCTFNQSVAATGRLSSQDPNLQNIPTRTPLGRKIREAFRPERSGWSYLSADYSQIELRLLAHLSGDPDLIQAFQHNEDIHAITASAIFNVPLKEVTKEQRYSAKAVNFGIIYGQQPYGLAQEIGVDVKEAALFIETYFKKYKKVKHYLENSKEEARKTGKAVTITGRERAMPEINNKNFMIRQAAERLATNTPLQGTAADLIKLAMLKIDSVLQKEQKLSYMILQIHDELIFEVPDFELLTMEQLVKEAMQGVFKLKVPLIVDISVGKNWKEC